MTDSDKDCGCPEKTDMERAVSSCLCCPCLQEIVEKVTSSMIYSATKAILEYGCCCKCDDGDGDGDGPGTGDGDSDGECKGGVGAEYLLDIDMKSDEGDGAFKPIASSFATNTVGYSAYGWRAFQKVKSVSHADCWAAKENSETPHHLGIVMEENKYVITKVEYDTRHLGGGNAGTPDCPPKEFNLKYCDRQGEWHDLTEIQSIEPQPPANQTVTIEVPEERRVACTGIRLEVYSSYGVSVTLSRMRIWVKDPCPQDAA